MNIRSFLSTLAMVLALIMTLSLLAACSKPPRLPATENSNVGESNTETETEPAETESETESAEDKTIIRYSGNPDYPLWAEAYLAALPDRDFGGATVFITSPDITMLDPEEVRFLSEVIAERNAAVEKKYNVKLVFSKQSSKKMLSEATKALESDMYYTDIMCVPLAKIDDFADAGVLANFRSLPFFDETQPYFNRSSAASLSAGYEFFGIGGEALPATDLPVVIFNRNIAKDLGIDDIYDVALEGKFTWKKFFEYAGMCNGSEKFTGAVIEGGKAYESVFYSLDNKFIRGGENGLPVVKCTPDAVSTTTYTVKKINAMANRLGINESNARQAFNEGKSLFIIGNVGELDEYRNSNVPVGILPMPKSTESAKYRSPVDGAALVMCVPANTKNPEMASLVLSALNAASYGYITEAAATYLHATTLPDNESADILEMISREAVYDLATAFSSSLPTIAAMKETFTALVSGEDWADLNTAAYNAGVELGTRFKLQN